MMNERISKIVLDLVAHAHEEEWFEFKENWYEPHELGVYISALSNVAALLGQDYGYLVWGVNDQTHEIVGTDFDQHADYKKECLPDSRIELRSYHGAVSRRGRLWRVSLQESPFQ